MAKKYDFYLAGEEHGKTFRAAVMRKIPQRAERIALEGLENREYAYDDLHLLTQTIAAEDRLYTSIVNTLDCADKKFDATWQTFLDIVKPQAEFVSKFMGCWHECRSSLLRGVEGKGMGSVPGVPYLELALETGRTVVGVEDNELYSSSLKSFTNQLFTVFNAGMSYLSQLGFDCSSNHFRAIGGAICELTANYESVARCHKVFENCEEVSDLQFQYQRALFERTNSWIGNLAGGPPTYLICGRLHVPDFEDKAKSRGYTTKITYMSERRRTREEYLRLKKMHLQDK